MGVIQADLVGLGSSLVVWHCNSPDSAFGNVGFRQFTPQLSGVNGLESGTGWGLNCAHKVLGVWEVAFGVENKVDLISSFHRVFYEVVLGGGRSKRSPSG